jgi:hypothetical protein
MTIAISLPGNDKNHEAMTVSLNGKSSPTAHGHTTPRNQLHSQAAASDGASYCARAFMTARSS